MSNCSVELFSYASIKGYFIEPKEISYPRRLGGVTVSMLTIPIGMVTEVIDGLYGMILSLGAHIIDSQSSHNIDSQLSYKIIEHHEKVTFIKHSLSFRLFIKMLNPRFDIADNSLGIQSFFSKKIKAVASNQAKSKESCFRRDIGSRGLFFTQAIVSIIARVVVFPLGLISFLFATLACGRCQPLNQFAVNNLTLTGIFQDLGEMFIHMHRPEIHIELEKIRSKQSNF